MEKMAVPRIPGYQIEKIIGQGAMATVYLAVQESLGRKIALKVLTPRLAADPTFNRRFINEGRIIAKLGHPHIVTIFDTGHHNDLYYIAMEYLEAGTLRERIKAGLTPEQAVKILGQIARALGYAHRQNCIHRDIKPANILFRDSETVVLSDFGIAKNLEDQTQLTAIGWRVGTPNYMSPEQTLGKPVDGRSDLYGLGVLFYEMLTGSRPYQGKDAFDTAMLHFQAPIPTLPEPLRRFQPTLERLLAKTPEARFRTAEDLVEALSNPFPAEPAAVDVKPWWRQPPIWILGALMAGLVMALWIVAYR